MKDKIKELRLRIDGLSQLVKELKPFTWIHGINKEAENTDADIYQMYLVSDSLSFSNTNHKYHTVIKLIEEFIELLVQLLLMKVYLKHLIEIAKK